MQQEYIPTRLSDREPLALRVITEHNADLVARVRQADRNLQKRHQTSQQESDK